MAVLDEEHKRLKNSYLLQLVNISYTIHTTLEKDAPIYQPCRFFGHCSKLQNSWRPMVKAMLKKTAQLVNWVSHPYAQLMEHWTGISNNTSYLLYTVPELPHTMKVQKDYCLQKVDILSETLFTFSIVEKKKTGLKIAPSHQQASIMCKFCYSREFLNLLQCIAIRGQPPDLDLLSN